MKLILLLTVVFFFSTTLFSQPRVILDTDIDSDVDDVEALAMLHTLADQKKIDFLGVIVTSDDPYAPTCASAINHYFGRPCLPLGFLQSQQDLTNHSKYTRQISSEFPRRLKSCEKAEEGTAVYRRLLNSSPDSSVVIVTIGHLTSFRRFLESGPDSCSDLTGLELADKKVVKWLCMGGCFPEGKEANFYRPDPASTVFSLLAWKKPVIFAGWEVGEKIKTGGGYLKSRLSPGDPVYRAYELYNGFAGRSSWDQVAVFLLIENVSEYFGTVKNGYCQVYEDGSNRWLEDKDSLHEYVVLRKETDCEDVARIIDDMSIKRGIKQDRTTGKKGQVTEPLHERKLAR